MFVIEDETHAEIIGEYPSFEATVERLRQLQSTAWDQEPNQAPCTNWRNCGRRYDIIEYDASTAPWYKKGRTSVLNVSANGIEWLLSEGAA